MKKFLGSVVLFFVVCASIAFAGEDDEIVAKIIALPRYTQQQYNLQPEIRVEAKEAQRQMAMLVLPYVLAQPDSRYALEVIIKKVSNMRGTLVYEHLVGLRNYIP